MVTEIHAETGHAGIGATFTEITATQEIEKASEDMACATTAMLSSGPRNVHVWGDARQVVYSIGYYKQTFLPESDQTYFL